MVAFCSRQRTSSSGRFQNGLCGNTAGRPNLMEQGGPEPRNKDMPDTGVGKGWGGTLAEHPERNGGLGQKKKKKY